MNPEQKDRADELAEKVRLQCDTIDVEIPSDVVDDIVDDYVADVIRQRESELSLQHQEREAAMLEQFHHLVDVADGYLQVKEFLKEDRFNLKNSKQLLRRRDERTALEKASELRQPIEDKSICPVGHMKANLTYPVDPVTHTLPDDPICLACQEQGERG